MTTPKKTLSEVVSPLTQKTGAHASPQFDHLPRFEEYQEHTRSPAYHPWGDVDGLTGETGPWWNIYKCLVFAACALFWMTLLWLLAGR